MVQGRHDPRLSVKYKKQRLIVLARDGYVCAYCGQDATTVDHIVSLKAGGDPIALDNMVACCKRCNSSKGSRSQGFFLARLSGERKTFFLLENKKERKNIHFSFRRERLLRTHYR